MASALRVEAGIVGARLGLLLRQVELAGGSCKAASESRKAAADRGAQSSFARVYAAFATARTGAGSWDDAARELVRATASDVIAFGSERSGYHDLESAVDSFRTLYCRRCHVFDCHLHGCGQLLPEARKLEPPADVEPSCSPCGEGCVLARAGDEAAESVTWSPMEQSLFTTAFKIHGRNSCRIARLIGTRTCAEVRLSLSHRRGHVAASPCFAGLLLRRVLARA